MAHPVMVSRFVSPLHPFCLPAPSTFLQEIHNKITTIGFEDCKVFIHSVDAQSSANGGIIIQVIGEMSNRGEPWKKFVQTFFLAEQPNGYFVLNDIFRFLKEENGESDEGEQEAVQVPVEVEQLSAPPQQDTEPPQSPLLPQPVPPADTPAPEPIQTASPTPATPSIAPTEETSPTSESPAEEPHTNGHTQVDQEASDGPPATLVEKSPTPEPEPTLAVESPAPAASPAPPPVLLPAPPQPPVPATTSQPAPTPAPAPAAPKTWANLAATNPKKWGSVAQESRGTSEAPAASSSTPGSGTQTPVSHHGPGARPQQQSREPHPLYVAATNVSNALCFVKVTCGCLISLIKP